MTASLLKACLTTSLLLVVYAVDGMPGDFGSPQACKAFRCGKKGTVAVPKRPLRLSSQGCSGMGGMMMMTAATDEKDKEILPCCDLRHACLAICGASKKRCETEFKTCTDVACAAIADPEEAKRCSSSASMQTMMAGLNGKSCQDFNEAQMAACSCVDTAKAPKRREQTLTDFYTKWGGETKTEVKEKVAKLAAKSDTPAKFAKLLGKLVAKFPKSIKKVKDPQAEYMENLMKGINKDAPPKEKKQAEPVADDGLEEEEAIDLDGSHSEL